MKDSEYQLSGATGDAYWLVPAVMLPVIVALTAVAGWVDAHDRNDVEVAMIFGGLLIAAVAALLYWLFRRARCRNPSAARWLSLGAACLTWYSGWVWFETCLPPVAPEAPNALTRYARRFIQPDLVWADARALNARGIHIVDSKGRKGFTTSKELWFGWSVDAVLTIGLIFWVANSSVKDEPFCERCGCWTTPARAFRYQCPKDEEVRVRAVEGDLDTVLALPPTSTPHERPRWILNVHICPQCNLTAAWQIILVETYMSKGVESDDNRVISPYFILPADELARFQPSQPPAA